MPEGSSSAAPVINPGPRFEKKRRNGGFSAGVATAIGANKSPTISGKESLMPTLSMRRDGRHQEGRPRAVGAPCGRTWC
jgi:hypothetical protein